MVFNSDFPPNGRLRKEIKSLNEAGHQVRVLCLGDSGEGEFNGNKVRKWEKDSWHVRDLTNPRSVFEIVGQLLLNVDFRWKREIEREVEEFDVDAIHVHDMPLFDTAKEAVDIPIILDMHENYKEAIKQYRADVGAKDFLLNPRKVIIRLFNPNWRFSLRQKKAINKSDSTIAIVPEAEKEYLDSGADQSKISIVSNTVDLDWFDANFPENENEGGDKVIGYVGTLSGQHRGVDTLIKAANHLDLEGVKVRIIGDGPRREYLEKLVSDQGLEDKVEFRGWVEEDSIPGEMSKIDVGVVPHRSNPHTNTTVPHKLFQYMAARLPVLATDTKPVRRIIKEIDAGRVVRPEDPERLAKGVIEILEEKPIYGKNGRKGVEKKYNWEKDGETLKEIYSELS
jgi:glycosyltransferase involved in cell wall biosynthesis